MAVDTRRLREEPQHVSSPTRGQYRDFKVEQRAKRRGSGGNDAQEYCGGHRVQILRRSARY